MNDTMLGKVFALSDAEEQAGFLNSAGRNLRRACVDGIEDMQLFRIVDHLDGNGRDLIKRLAATIECDEQTPKVTHVHKVVEVPVYVPAQAEAEPKEAANGD